MQAESSKFASLSLTRGSKYLVIPPRSPASVPERHLTVFCIDPIVVYYVNSLNPTKITEVVDNSFVVYGTSSHCDIL